jgi:hypothetical protein
MVFTVLVNTSKNMAGQSKNRTVTVSSSINQYVFHFGIMAIRRTMIRWTTIRRTMIRRTTIRRTTIHRILQHRTTIHQATIHRTFTQHWTPEHRKTLVPTTLCRGLRATTGTCSRPNFDPRDTLGPKSGFCLYNSGPDSPLQALGDEKTEFFIPG